MMFEGGEGMVMRTCFCLYKGSWFLMAAYLTHAAPPCTQMSVSLGLKRMGEVTNHVPKEKKERGGEGRKNSNDEGWRASTKKHGHQTAYSVCLFRKTCLPVSPFRKC